MPTIAQTRARAEAAQKRARADPYAKFDRGGNPHGTGLDNPASPAFLAALLADLRTLRDQYVLGKEWLHMPSAVAALRHILRECERLRQIPVLFASEDARRDFFHSLYYYCKAIVELARLARFMDEAEARRTADAREKELEEHYAPLVPGLTPWRQFLGNGALGCGSDYDVDVEEGQPGTARGEGNRCVTVQFVPDSAIDLVTAWVEETMAVKEAMEQRGANPIPRPDMVCRPDLECKYSYTVKANDRQAEEDEVPPTEEAAADLILKFAGMEQQAQLWPSPFTKNLRNRVELPGPERLETLNRFLWLAEERQEAPREDSDFFAGAVARRWTRGGKQKATDADTDTDKGGPAAA